jgi:hypothetical protein
MTSMHIHGVKRITVEDIKEQFSGSFVRGIIIETDTGEEIEIALFSRTGPEVLEFRPEAMEDWK